MPNEDTQPTTIGRYKVERLLGSGAMGNVFLATDPELDRLVAIKTLRNLGLDDAARSVFLERFRNEARAAARLQHPAIVQVYDVGEDGDLGPYLVFEYVPGTTVRKLLATRGPFSPRDLVWMAEEIGEALQLAHEGQVIHRDIKPDNLLVSEAGGTKLADFGVARVPNAALTREGQFLGTPCYAAPETLQDGIYGPASDVFSFAAVLYEVATGTRAFPGDEALAVVQKVLHETPKVPSEVAPESAIPSAVDAILLAAMAKDPAERPASARDLADALREAYAAAGLVPERTEGRVGAPLRSPGEDRARDASPSPWGWFLALAAIAALAAAFLWVLPEPGTTGAIDAGVGAADAAAREAATPPPTTPDASIEAQDTGAPRSAAEASVPNAQPQDAAADAFVEVLPTRPPPAHNVPLRGSPEEIAKDAVDQARRLLREGRLDEARQALELARAHDPGLDDIRILEAQLPR